MVDPWIPCLTCVMLLLPKSSGHWANLHKLILSNCVHEMSGLLLNLRMVFVADLLWLRNSKLIFLVYQGTNGMHDLFS